MSFRIRLWPTFFSLIGLGLLITLGSWQLSRFLDARAFEEERDATMDLPVANINSPDQLMDGEFDFRHINVRGRWDEERVFLIKHRIYQGKPGLWVVQPLHISGEEGSRAILVNRGWVSVEDGVETAKALLSDPYDLQGATRELPAAALSDSGQMRGYAEGLMHRLDDEVADQDFRDELDEGEGTTGVIELESYDATAMHRAVGADTLERPIVLTQISEYDDEYPVASLDHITEPYLTAETHFGYMLTWYFLAIALVAIWIASGFGLLTSPAYADNSSTNSSSRG